MYMFPWVANWQPLANFSIYWYDLDESAPILNITYELVGYIKNHTMLKNN